MVKNLPVMQETWVQSLCQEDPLEKITATHSSILAWRILSTEEPAGILYPWDFPTRILEWVAIPFSREYS